jgi:hypothetical protein
MPIQVNEYHSTLESAIRIGLGLHDRNVSFENLYKVKKLVIVNIYFSHSLNFI